MWPISRSPVVLAVSLLLVLAGCGGGDGPTGSDTGGDVRVSVTAGGSPWFGVTVRLFEGTATTSAASATTSEDGVTTFGDLDPGPHDVEIDLPPGLVVATGGTTRRTVVVTDGATANVGIALVAAGGGDVVEVLATNGLVFTDADITVPVGSTVRWRSVSSMLHTVTPEGHGEWAEGTLPSAGATFTHTFGTAGTFDYFCVPHVSAGMTGRVVVQ